MSFPEVIFISIFPAPFIERSKSGVFSACSTAFFALSSPSAFPKPNTVLPEFCNIDLMSAKVQIYNSLFFYQIQYSFYQLSQKLFLLFHKYLLLDFLYIALLIFDME